MSCVAKLFHLLLMHRVREALDPWLSPTQNAYRPSRGCQQHIVAANLLHQFAMKHDQYELHLTFVDFLKALTWQDSEVRDSYSARHRHEATSVCAWSLGS